MSGAMVPGETIRLEGVSKHYGRVVALERLDLTIQPGEFISLLGPSGSGKSTTLNILAGLTRPETGKVYIGDRDVTMLSPDKRDIAMVFQNYALYPHMTVAQNLAFPLRARSRRRSHAEIEAKVTQVSETLGIGSLLERYPREISGGQQQRVALGRATVRDPKVFLLDEPLSNLDARLRLKMRHDLKELHLRLRSTIVYVTHDQGEAMSLSDRIAIYQSGALQQVASPLDIYRRPTNMFVANFMGEREMTNLEGRVERQGQEYVFRTSGITLALGTRQATWEAVVGRSTILGIRPDGVQVGALPNATHTAARISIVEHAGDEQIVFAVIGDVEICGKAPADQQLTAGDEVTMSLFTSEMYLFDQVTQQTLVWGGV